MGCKGCPEIEKSEHIDRHGNPVHPQAEFEAKVQEANKQEENIAEEALNMSYQEYIQRRDNWRVHARRIGEDKIATFSEDYKRIQIEELIGVYNMEEVHFKLTPNQALVALYEFTHSPVYQSVIDEFKGLREQIDKKHNILMANRIDVKWSP